MKNLGRIVDRDDIPTKGYVDDAAAQKQDELRIVTLFLSGSWTAVQDAENVWTQDVALDGATNGTVVEPMMDRTVLAKMTLDNVKYLWAIGGTNKITFYCAGTVPFSAGFALDAVLYDAVDDTVEREANAAGGNTVTIDNGTASYTDNASGGNTVDISG